MKKLSTAVFRLCACTALLLSGLPAARAQDVGPGAAPQTNRMATFKGGDAEKFTRWVNNHVRYPREALKESAEGKVTYSFVVGEDGRVKDIRIVKSPSQSLSDEVIRVLERAPRWKPAIQDGKPVKVRFQSSVIFLPNL